MQTGFWRKDKAGGRMRNCPAGGFDRAEPREVLRQAPGLDRSRYMVYNAKRQKKDGRIRP